MLSLNLWERLGWMKKEGSSFNNAICVCLNAKYGSFEKFEKYLLVHLNLWITFAGNQDDISIKTSPHNDYSITVDGSHSSCIYLNKENLKKKKENFYFWQRKEGELLGFLKWMNTLRYNVDIFIWKSFCYEVFFVFFFKGFVTKSCDQSDLRN